MNTSETHVTIPRSLAHINSGLSELRRALSARVPSDFGWCFNLSESEVHLAYWWTGDDLAGLPKEVRAQNVRDLLVCWQAIDWTAERREASENVAACAR